MAGWKSSLAAVLKEQNGRKATDGTIASHETQEKRASVLYQGFSELRSQGYKLDSVTQLKGKHVEVLCKVWLEAGLSASTLQNRLSIFRTFAGWIGKAGMIEKSDRYFKNSEARRTSIAQTEKSWFLHNFESLKENLEQLDPRVAMQVELQQTFGLRVKEAVMLKPHLADKGSYLAVSIGTKGGRDRTVPISGEHQRALLERAKAMCSLSGSIADPKLSLKQALGRYSRIVRKAGISKKDLGVTSHGLRHFYANIRYLIHSGSLSPIQGGDRYTTEEHKAARILVSEELGHSRASVTTHYLG